MKKKQKQQIRQPLGRSLKLNGGLTVTAKNHARLINHVIERMEWAAGALANFRDNIDALDNEIAGQLILSDSDKRRENDNKRNYGVKPTDAKLPLILTQIDEGATILANTLAPPSGMYNAVANAELQKAAKGVAVLMNQHGELFGHYPELTKGLHGILRYNLAGWETNWEEVYGNRISTSGIGAKEIEHAVVKDGNSLKSVSVYNTLWDPSVSVLDVTDKGEFYATVEKIADFPLRRMISNEEIDITVAELETLATGEKTFYKEPPKLRGTITASTRNPWHELFSNGTTLGESYEISKFTGWIVPNKFGLSTSSDYEIWRFYILNNSRVIKAVHLTNAHGMLPVAFCKAQDDEFSMDTKSYAELLVPMQRFSSYQMNVHQRAARKALYGLTLYIKNKIPALANIEDTDDMLAGRIPVDNVEDLNKVFKQVFDAPNTDNTLRDVGYMQELMQHVLPTDTLKQVAGLERSTQYQAAATVQSAERRHFKLARTIESTALAKLRHMMLYNIMEYQKGVDILDPQGNIVEINPSELRDSKLQFAIKSGLSGIDKLIVAESVKEVVTMLIQNREAAAEYKVSDIINYMTSLLGDTTDFSQFLKKSQFDTLTPEMKEQAMQLLQQAMQQAQQQEGGAG